MIDLNRSVVRAEFASLLSAALVGNGKPAQIVKAFRWGGIQGESPVVIVSSAGTNRKRLTFRGSLPAYRIQVDVFVLYSVPDDPAYTEADAENLLDLTEYTISQVVDANQKNAHWDAIMMPDSTVREDVEIGGVSYIREFMMLDFS